MRSVPTTPLRPGTLAGCEVPQPACIKAGIVIKALFASAALSVIVLPFDSIGDGTGTVGPDFVDEPDEAGEHQTAGQQFRPGQHHLAQPRRRASTYQVSDRTPAARPTPTSSSIWTSGSSASAGPVSGA